MMHEAFEGKLSCAPGGEGALWHEGWYVPAQRIPSPNFGPRPVDVTLDLAVIHAISLPPGVYGGDAIERLFTNRLDESAHPYYAQIQGLTVSAHFLIRRNGALSQFVAVTDRAWHAGPSRWRERDNCNDFSVGIELEGLEGLAFEASQYQVLTTVLQALRLQWGVRYFAGHEHVAPGRKRDPGPGFDWRQLIQSLGWGSEAFAPQ